jgi:hypothetical protein
MEVAEATEVAVAGTGAVAGTAAVGVEDGVVVAGDGEGIGRRSASASAGITRPTTATRLIPTTLILTTLLTRMDTLLPPDTPLLRLQRRLQLLLLVTPQPRLADIPLRRSITGV